MLLLALVLILAAAFLHAGWNVLVKVSKDALALMWWGSFLGTVGYGVWVLTFSNIYLNSASWLPFLISAAAETGYFVTLVRGYSEGDLSIVYPISRGGAPIFAAIWSAIILGERLSFLGYCGVGLIVGGIFLVSFPIERRESAKQSFRLISFKKSVVLWAFACAVFISIFSVSDKVAVAGTAPLVYNWWVIAGNTLFWSPIVWRKSRLKINIQEIKTNLYAAIGTGIGISSAYAAALAALALTSASYVVAGRGLSVVIGSAVGALFLKESFGRQRILGAIIMVSGLALIAFS